MGKGDIAEAMKRNGAYDEMIALSTGLTLEEVKRL